MKAKGTSGTRRNAIVASSYINETALSTLDPRQQKRIRDDVEEAIADGTNREHSGRYTSKLDNASLTEEAMYVVDNSGQVWLQGTVNKNSRLYGNTYRGPDVGYVLLTSSGSLRHGGSSSSNPRTTVRQVRGSTTVIANLTQAYEDAAGL